MAIPRPSTNPYAWLNQPLKVGPADKSLTVRIPVDLKQRIRFLAKQGNITMSEVVMRSLILGKSVQ